MSDVENREDNSLKVRHFPEPQWAETARNFSVLILIVILIVSVYHGLSTFPPRDPPVNLVVSDGENGFRIPPGLSPSIAACYSIESRVSSLIIAISLGVSLGLTYYFGNFVYKKFRDSVVIERRLFFGGIAERLKGAKVSELSEIINSFNEHEKLILDRRNIYWGLFLRAILALVVVSLIALLIAVCKIEAQAGLPIITGIIAFIIGQGAESLHGGGPVVVLRGTDDEKRPAAPKDQPT